MAIEIKEYVGHEPQHVKEVKTTPKKSTKKDTTSKKETIKK